MAKWGISKRGKRYYNLRDGDGQFTDDGIPNGSIPSLSDVAQARVANTLRNSAGFRKPSNKDKTASTTRFTGAKSSKIDSRGEADRLNLGRNAQAEEKERAQRVARETAGSAKAAKPAVAGLPDFTEEAKKPASSFERKVLRDLGDAQKKGIIGKSGLTPQQKQMRDAGMNAEGRDRLLVAAADNPKKFKEQLSKLDNDDLKATAERLDGYMKNMPERMDGGALMEARSLIASESNRRRGGQTPAELAKQNPDAQVRPKRAPKLTDDVLEEMDRLDGHEDTDADALNAVRESLANGHMDDAIAAAWGGGLEDLAEKLESAAPAKTSTAKDQGMVAGLKNAQAGWQKEEADRIARGWPAREDPFQAQIDNLQKPYEPEGKDARSMTAAEKLAAGRAMYGDKVSKQKGFNELQKAAEAESAKKGIIDVPESELDEQDITLARTGLLRATRSMNPKDRQAYYNDAATNGSTAQKVAAKSMGGRDLNAPGVGLPSKVGLSPERQRLEAARKSNPATKNLAPKKDIDIARGLDAITNGGNMPPHQIKETLERAAINSNDPREKAIIAQRIAELDRQRDDRIEAQGGFVPSRAQGDKPSEKPWIPAKPDRLRTGRERAKADAEVARLQARLNNLGNSPQQRARTELELSRAKKAAQQLRIAEQNEQSDRAQGLPKRAGAPDPRKRSSIGAAIVATEKQINQLEQVMARGGLGAQERLKNQTRINNLNDDLVALQKREQDRDAALAQPRKPRSVDLTSSAPGRENDAMERAANKVLDSIGTPESRLAEARQEVDSLEYLLSDGGLEAQDRREIKQSLASAKRDLKSLEREASPSNKVGVKSRPAVEYGSDYADMPAEKQKTYRSKRRKLIDTAMEAGLPPEEIKRIFAQPMSSWPSAAELKRRK